MEKLELIPVRLVFTGVAEVLVPKSVPTGQRRALAEKFALARILATAENADPPDDAALLDYAEEFELNDDTAGRHWDGCQIQGVGGGWTLKHPEEI